MFYAYQMTTVIFINDKIWEKNNTYGQNVSNFSRYIEQLLIKHENK